MLAKVIKTMATTNHYKNYTLAVLRAIAKEYFEGVSNEK